MCILTTNGGISNPWTIVCRLQVQQEEIWHGQVTVVSGDMRNWEPPELADILVSELLGSFGDNELSPECLDGVQKCLKGQFYRIIFMKSLSIINKID